jgi:tyrocidine synthetase III
MNSEFFTDIPELFVLLKNKNISIKSKNGNIELVDPENNITQELINQIKVQKSDIIEFLDIYQQKDEYQPIPLAKKQEYYALSSMQKRLYFLWEMDKSLTNYNIPSIVYLKEAISKEKLVSIFQELSQRHEMFRASFHIMNENPCLKIADFLLPIIDFIETDKKDVEKIVKNFIQPFDLSKAPLIHILLVNVKNGEQILLIDMHHIISDGISNSILKEEFLSLYKDAPLEPIKIQYKDFTEWQKSNAYKNLIERQEKYWLDLFSDEINVLQLPTDFPRSKYSNYSGSKESFTINKNLTDAIKNITKNNGSTLFITLLSIFNVLLYKLTNQEDIVIGVPVSGRNHPDLGKIIGFFVNTLALRNKPNGEISFIEFCEQVKENSFKALDNQDYEFGELVDKLNIARDISRNPLFDVMFSLLNHREYDNLFENTNKEKYYEFNIASKFDLTLHCSEKEGELLCSFTYATQLFKNTTIKNFAQYFIKVLEAIVNINRIKISEISLLSEAEKKHLLYELNNTKAEYPKEKTIIQLFEEQVIKTPEKIAVVFEGNKLTYREINIKANQLANLIIQKQVIPTVISIRVEPSLETIIGIIGILKSGSAFLPIDAYQANNRSIDLIKDSGSKLLLTQEHLKADILHDGDTIIIDKIKPEKQEIKNPNVKATELLYIIYTSGSTGKPKGVQISNKNMLNYYKWFTGIVDLSSKDKGLLTTSFAFDAIYTQLISLLLEGGEIHIIPKNIYLQPSLLIDYSNDNKITILKMTPTLFNMVVNDPNFTYKKWKDVRFLMLGGEAILSEDVEKLHKLLPEMKIMNHYGPTETTIGSIAQYIEDIESFKKRPTIGKPINNTKVYILGKSLELLPCNVAGELCISGDGVSMGYLNRPELTEEKFIKSPFNPEEILYKTGDLARWLPDGNIEYLGRIDQQVKIRGNRVEPGEIETTLGKYEKIKEAIVIARGEAGNKYLCAYIVSKEKLEISELRLYLSQSLPDYMIPSYFVWLESIPLTPNGKIDRKLLPEPDFGSTNEYIAPVNEIENFLVTIWSEVLGIEKGKISTNANFFELGGHSLKAMVLVSRINKKFEVDLPLKEMFNLKDIQSISKYIKGSSKKEFISIKPVEKKEYYKLSSPQKRLYMIQAMDAGSVAYNMPQVIPLPEGLTFEKLESILNEILCRHESLRSSFLMLADEPFQKVQKNIHLNLELYEIAEEKDLENLRERFIRPFDLSKAPLIRAGFVKISYSKSLLLLDKHHIISDGVSETVLRDEFMYMIKGDRFPPLKLQYKDYAHWQNSNAYRSLVLQQEKFWVNKYSSEIPILEMPLDYSRPTIQSNEGYSFHFIIGKDKKRQLNDLARKNNATLYMVLLAIYNILLSRLSGLEDMIVGTPVAARRHSNLERIIGIFINTLAIRTFPNGKKWFLEFLQEVKEEVLQAFENQEYQFEDLIDKISIKRDTSRNPLFDVMFVLQNQTDRHDAIMDMAEGAIYSGGYQSAKFDMELAGIEKGENLLFTLNFCTKLFKPETVKRFITYFTNIINEVISNPDIKISEIEILSEEEKSQLLYEFNNTCKELPKDITINEIIEAQSIKSPDQIAVVYKNISLSYNELNSKSNQLAAYLKELGVVNNSLVAIYCEPSIEFLIGILAIFKAGGAYIPIDVTFPIERLNAIMDNSEAKFLITKTHLLSVIIQDNKFNSNTYLRHIINLDEASIDGYSTNSITVVNQNAFLKYQNTKIAYVNNADDLSYIIYTSGTTGKPKGAMIHHRGMLNHLYSKIDTLAITSKDIIAQTASVSFDISVWQFLAALLVGGTTYIIEKETILEPEKFIKALQHGNVTILESVPSLIGVFLDAAKSISDKSLKTLRWMIPTGESLSVSLATKWFKSYPKIKLVNAYGPTEASDDITHYIVKNIPDKHEKTIPIGKPIQNMKIYIMDNNLNICPIGVKGEICVSGIGVGKGYWKDEEKTQSVFVENPYCNEIGDSNHSILYKTGDIGYYKEDGNLECLGRKDYQVKIRGYRIELGEIEKQLELYPAVKEAIVIVKENKNKEKYLCAYIVLLGEITNEELRSFLFINLPDYMVPSYIIQLAKIPITANGKIDRKALPDPAFNSSNEIVAPKNSIENKLAFIWSEILGVDKESISTTKSFFELGGHSLKAVTLASKIHQSFNTKINLSNIFSNSTIEGMSVVIQNSSFNKFTSIKKVEKREYYPLSSSQKRLFILHQLDKESTAYNMPIVLKISGQPNINKVEATFNKIIKRHDSFRTIFSLKGLDATQKISDTVCFKIITYKSETTNVENLIKSFIKPFDLAKPPLIRVNLVELTDQQAAYILFIDMHHIISDGISMNILVNEFLMLYEEHNLSELEKQYKDYSEWQNHYFKEEAFKEQEEYWVKLFSEEIAPLELPVDFTRPVVQSFQGDTIQFKLGKHETSAIKAIAKEEDVTLFILLFSIYNVFLSKISRLENITVGTPVSGRRHTDLDKIIGVFMNTLVLKNTINHDDSFKELLSEVKNNCLNAFDNQDYPYERLIERIVTKRDTSRNPLFDVMFVFQELEDTLLNISGIEISPYIFKNKISKFDLTLFCSEKEDDIVFSFEYCTKIFRKETISRFIDYFRNAIREIINHREIRLKDIEIITKDEKQKLLFDFNNTAANYPKSRTIDELLEEQAIKTPASIALIYKESNLDYQTLNYKSDQLAAYLRTKGVKENGVIALMLDRSLEMMIGLYGILKAGCAYLPIDPDYPPERINYMLENSEAKIIITQKELEEKLSNQHIEVIDIKGEKIYKNQAANQKKHHSTNLAYLIYTSGSTGKPKGIMVEHKNVVNFITGVTAMINFEAGKKLLSLTTISFDIFVLETLLALSQGLSVVIGTSDEQSDPKEIATSVKRNNVELLQLTPSRLKMLLMSGESAAIFGQIKNLMIGGEAFPLDLLIALKSVYKGRIFNMYGPTETTVWSSIQELTNETEITLGKPIANTQFYILENNLMLCPTGVAGELCIGGDGITRGYWKLEGLTEEKFIQNPYIKGERIYKTGDLARRRYDGAIEFLGRLDHQVKIRGYRIELGEIEQHLNSFENIKESVVVAIGESSNKLLCAYFVSDSEIKSSDLRVLLSKNLPDYMLPNYFVQIEKIPLTPNGKINRKALPSPEVAQDNVFIPPQNEVEILLTGIWSTVLNVSFDKISTHANFFEMGGHSLSVVIVIKRINEELSTTIPYIEFFKRPTISELAIYLQKRKVAIKGTNIKNMILLKESVNSDKHIFFVHAGSGEATAYSELCEKLENDFNYWGIKSDTLEGFAPVDFSILKIAEKYTKLILEIQPEGNYYLSGWCVGGTIAFEIAKNLERINKKVEFLGIINSSPPNPKALKSINDFSIQSEINLISELLFNKNNLPFKGTSLNALWLETLEYLEEKSTKEFIRTILPSNISSAIPLIQKQSTQMLIFYTNIVRSYIKARNKHIPKDKVITKPFYFSANSATYSNWADWNNYSQNSVHYIEVHGDHFSILKNPDVSSLSKAFQLALKKIAVEI